MTEGVSTLPRDLLAKAVGNNPRVVAAFEAQAAQVDAATSGVAEASQATQALQDARVLVLAPNDAFTNERIFRAGDGLDLDDNGEHLTVKASDTVPHVMGGFRVQMTAQAVTNLVLPLSGTLATQSGTETLRNKTLDQPKASGLSDYANDAAAAGGGVPVGGVYRNGSVLMVRVA